MAERKREKERYSIPLHDKSSRHVILFMSESWLPASTAICRLRCAAATSQSTHPSVNPCLVTATTVASVRYNDVFCNRVSSNRSTVGRVRAFRKQYYFSSRWQNHDPGMADVCFGSHFATILSLRQINLNRTVVMYDASLVGSIRSPFRAVHALCSGILATSEYKQEWTSDHNRWFGI